MALEGFDTTLSYKSGAAYTALGGLQVANGPDLEAEPVVVSDNDSQWKRKLSGIADAGNLEATLSYDPDQRDALYALFNVEDVLWRITHADGSGWDVTGILTKLGQEAPHDDAISQAITIAIDGEPTPISAS